MAYIFLALAIITEVIGTTLLKSTEEFTKIGPSIIVVISYLLSFYFLTLTLRTIPVGIAYAIWAGLGIFLVTLFAGFIYKQTPDLPAMLGMGLIIAGVVIIHLFSKSADQLHLNLHVLHHLHQR